MRVFLCLCLCYFWRVPFSWASYSGQLQEPPSRTRRRTLCLYAICHSGCRLTSRAHENTRSKTHARKHSKRTPTLVCPSRFRKARRRPTQCLWTLCIKTRATRPPLQPKQAVCPPTSNRSDRVAGGSRRTGCIKGLQPHWTHQRSQQTKKACEREPSGQRERDGRNSRKTKAVQLLKRWLSSSWGSVL